MKPAGHGRASVSEFRASGKRATHGYLGLQAGLGGSPP